MMQLAELTVEISNRLAAGARADAIIEWLVQEHGFVWTRDREPMRLRGAGISCSCTAGPHGLLTNWAVAATRQCGALVDQTNSRTTLKGEGK